MCIRPSSRYPTSCQRVILHDARSSNQSTRNPRLHGPTPYVKRTLKLEHSQIQNHSWTRPPRFRQAIQKKIPPVNVTQLDISLDRDPSTAPIPCLHEPPAPSDTPPGHNAYSPSQADKPCRDGICTRNFETASAKMDQGGTRTTPWCWSQSSCNSVLRPPPQLGGGTNTDGVAAQP